MKPGWAFLVLYAHPGRPKRNARVERDEVHGGAWWSVVELRGEERVPVGGGWAMTVIAALDRATIVAGGSLRYVRYVPAEDRT